MAPAAAPAIAAAGLPGPVGETAGAAEAAAGRAVTRPATGDRAATPRIALSLPAAEQRLAAGLAGPWLDLLYAPGPGFTSLLDPGVFRASFVVVLAGSPMVRVSSFVTPAFGGELCRLRLEPLETPPGERLGSFFEPSRHGLVYVMSGDRGSRAPDRADWSYQGESLGPRLGRVARVQVLRERVAGFDNGEPIGWVADRGLVLLGADGGESLFLAEPEGGEQAAFLPAAGAHRILLDPSHTATPGASVQELLGHGDRDSALEVTVELETLAVADRS